MKSLEGNVAIVTGGTFGVGRGIASALTHCGARVFVTGRSVKEGAPIEDRITGIRCDHRLDAEVAAAFERVAQEQYPLVKNPIMLKMTDQHRRSAVLDLGEPDSQPRRAADHQIVDITEEAIERQYRHFQ